MEPAREPVYQLAALEEIPHPGTPGLPGEERVIYADVLRVAASLGVVALHTIYISWIMFSYNTVPRGWWLTGDVVNSLFRWCVPIFVMLSGMLLLDPAREEPISLFFRKRMARVLIPFLFWGVFYTFWSLRTIPEVLSRPGIYRDLAVGLVEGPVYYHFWFLYLIIGLYLVTPILRPYARNAGNSNLAYFLFLWLMGTGLYGLLGRFAHVEVGFSIQLAMGMAGYFIMGFYLNRIDVTMRRRRLLYLLALVAIAAAAWGTYYLTARHAGGFDDYFFGYLSPNTMVVSAAVFLFFKYVRWDRLLAPSRPARARLLRLSEASFGIYLVHALILDILMYSHISASLIHPIIGIPLTVVLTLVLSYAFVRLLQSLPYVRRLVG
jgi:surface polysaccharide O-acyltransferase-like enzyme